MHGVCVQYIYGGTSTSYVCIVVHVVVIVGVVVDMALVNEQASMLWWWSA